MSNDTSKEATGSHAFFFTLLFMTSIVVLTIVGYFLFLPKTAPKLVIVAVLPFDAPDNFPRSLTRELPRHLAETLAESRDLFVVDYAAAEEAAELKERSRGFRNELGTTHIVDGSYETTGDSPDAWVLNMRLIDVGKDVWKLKWSNEYRYPELSVLDIRSSIASEVASGLYDNSIPDRDPNTFDSLGFVRYLEASALFYSGKRDEALTMLEEQTDTTHTPFGMLLMAQLRPLSQQDYVERSLALQSDYFPALILQSKLRYQESGHFANYVREMIEHARRYPNSDAVKELALLYYQMGWFEEAQDVLLRWAQIRPRSSEPGLAIAFNRFRLGDLKGVEEALEIARLRDPQNELVDRYKALYEWKVKATELNVGDSQYLSWIARHDRDEFSPLDPEWIRYLETLTCDERIELSLYLNNFEYIFGKYECNDRNIWLQPPPWWVESDPKWVAFKDAPEYEPWQSMKGIRSVVLDTVRPAPAKELFAPERNVVPAKEQ